MVPPSSCSRGLSRVSCVCIYTGDVVKRLGTYRVDCDLLASAAVCAAERGETVTNVIVNALQAYIRACKGGEIVSEAPVAAPPVYTPPETPAGYKEPSVDPPCRHPADQVDPDAGVCRACGADVW